MAARPVLSLENVSITHPDTARPTPAGVTFDVRAGEVVLLLGPSGCGKSTLAMAMNGLVPHALDADLDGRVTVAGLDTAAATPAQLSPHVGMVFQDPDAQIVTGAVLDEVAFGLENLLLPAEEVLSRAERALRTVGLWDRRDDDPAELSGGGRQRLAFACAVAAEPELLVLDEPTANLDPAGRADLYAALDRLITADADRAIVLVEHDVDAARGLATRVIVLDHDGRTALDGTPDEVFGAHAVRLRELGVGADGGAAHPDEGAVTARGTERADAGDGAATAGAGTPRGPELAGAGDGAAAADGATAEAVRPESAAVAHPDAAAVTARGLTVVRGRGRAAKTLLRGVDLAVPRGSFTAIVGPNGAGKTTLAQALAGVVPTTRGQVSIARDGAAALDPATARPKQLAAQVGFVFQNPEHQFVTHTVRDELGYALRHLDPADRDARVDAMLDRFDLGEHADRHPFRLSGGQKRRLSVGTALIGGADRPGGVLVLDEPTYGQDRARADELLSLLDDLHRGGTTVIVVTHDPALVERHATHIAAVRDGGLAAFGPAADVLPIVSDVAFWRGADEAGAGETPLVSGAGGAGADAPSAHADTAAADTDGMSAAATSASATDSASSARRPALLERLDPLAALVAVLPALIGLIFTRDIATPALAIAATYVVVLVGAAKTRALAMWLCVVLPVTAAVIAAGFSLWSDPATGIATGLRLAALLAVALIPGLSTQGVGFVRSAVAHLRVPYRVGYAALAAYGFVPRFRHESAVIRAAHRVRGSGGNPLSRLGSSIVPLMASAIRHAERVALTMDARAFGAFPTRTERTPPVWRRRDTIAVVVGVIAAAVLFVGGAAIGV